MSNTGHFHSAGRLDLDMFVNRFRLQRFVFTVASAAFDITSFTWQLVVRSSAGNNTPLINLTLGNGLSFPIYETNVIEARFESSVTKIAPGQKYVWQLIRTDTDEVWLNGFINMSFGPLDSSGAAQEVEVNLIDSTVTVNLGAILDFPSIDAALALKQNLLNNAVALTDAATIDLTAIKHTLTTASSRTFTISYTGDDITLEITLNAASATMTFPATAFCVSEGVASGDNLLALSGVSGDKYIIAIKKIGSAYYVVCKNFGQ